ncbi:ABC transporter permease [Rickettsiales bacterium]|nr:ABC transporter permease [Rickettsiales bacterium]
MNMFSLARRYITANLPTTLLQILTFGAGTAILLIVINISTQLTNNFSQGKNGIDVVVGAKGSPLQLVLSSVYHSDIPTGNIDYAQAKRLSRHSSVKDAVPISLGDSYRGYRIVGTTENFLKFYDIQPDEGVIWTKKMEALIGYNVAKASNLKVGDSFIGSHGLAQGGDEHEHMPYKVVGILNKSGTIADRLLLTSLESVWEIHGHNHHEDHDEGEGHGDHHEHEDEHHDDEHEHNGHKEETHHEEEKEITALLIEYKNRAAAINFPRMVNKQTNMQAASPYFEMAKLFKMLGVGFDMARIIGYVLLTISVISIFLALLGNIRRRNYDMAILRVFGATPAKIIKLVISEAMILALLGIIIGFITSRAVLFFIGKVAADSTGFAIELGGLLQGEIFIIGIILFASFIASIIPAIMAYRVNIVDLLLKRT